MTHRFASALLLTALFGLAACGSDDTPTAATTDPPVATSDVAPDLETHRLWVGPDLVECEGVGPQTCMLIATSSDGEPELFYDAIEGFTFVEGTSYVIDVTIEEVPDPPADGSSLAYTLADVVEATPSDG